MVTHRMLMIGGCNAKSCNLPTRNTAVIKRAHLDSFSSGIEQLISEPDYILENSPSCIFTNKLDSVMDS